MDFFTSGFFWFLEGIFFCLILVGFRIRMQDKNIQMPLWKWIFFIIWIIIFGFTIAFITTSFGENEPTAAIRGGILFGIITIVTGVGLWRLIIMNRISSARND